MPHSSSSPSSVPTISNLRFRALILGFSKNYAIAAFVFLLLFSLSIFSHLDSRSRSRPGYPSHPRSTLVPLTLLRNVNRTRALCLDGSAPGYHFQSGFGSGSRNWLLHIEGGGWCNSIASCTQRKFTHLGSSNYMEKLIPFSGILSPDPSQNPDFFNWNKVKIRYCDGASFAGHPESEQRGSELFFRGQVIWEAIMDELLSIGLSEAKQALLSGCSAGGLAALIHCDNFRQVLPKEATVKCLSDAGFFLDEKDISGNSTMRSFYHDVAQLQCLFPQEIVKNIKTPLFLVHPAYDFWQIRNILVPQGSDPLGHWQSCRLNIRNCNANMIDKLDGYRGSLLKTLNEFLQRKEIGMFINSCFVHCQTEMEVTWHSPNSPKINDKTIAESVGDWYFDREAVKRIDCSSFPCNPTCHNMDFT
ncbi:pectin acetylesterase 5-like isoform X3 [Vigna unguiculata]|uniref:pectin acetylesterase 5-like isoform X3 n=1 Tax=Vigna unguiculata TaxID=3917 RepID=UPI001016CB04|nr:pectin acetylesterase 5-like isoform X3 [Vigna unguiculata]